MLPTLVLVGRPNVGKSTLFNRLTKTRDALVADFPGLTRDRHYGRGRVGDRPFLVVDTGGFEPVAKDGILHEMARQTKQAIAEADAVIFLVDARSGLTPQDRTIAELLRRCGRPVILAANKAEGLAPERAAAEFHELGLGEPCPISSAHGENVSALIELALARIPELPPDIDPERGAAGAGIKVAFFGVDSSRADLEFYRRAYETAVEAGAQEVVVVDTIGIATPEAAAYLVGQTVDWLGGEIPVHWHGHDDFGLGTAAAVAAVQAGATWVQGTINGMGERAGNADLIEVALALEALYGIPTRLDLTQARALSQLVQERAGTPLPSWKAVTGDALFTRESGAVAAQFHDPPAIEPYSSELVGATRGIVLGKKSGIDSIRIVAERLGLEVAEERRAELLAAVKQLGTQKGGLVSDEEFAALVAGG